MKITFAKMGPGMQEKLRERLDRAALLRCAEHEQPLVSVTIYGRENGWFDAQYTACCDSLAQEAVSIVKERC